jgi:hypothetical protein
MTTYRPEMRHERGQDNLLSLFTATMFLSALLLFLVQPMFTKSVLPLLGGSPAVWNTALVFFQGTLLAGYLYVHATDRWLGPRRQSILHLAVLFTAFIFLPIGRAAGWTPPATASPTLWLLGLLTVSIGLPFFAVSATAPLLQRWISYTDHPAAADPYFLYSASNLGSIIALLLYPAVAEPLIGLHDQGIMWTWGYGCLVILIASSAFLSARRLRAAATERADRQAAELASSVTAGTRFRWLLLAFAPSSLLLGVTGHLTTDVAAVPLFWVVPLALYLLSFALVFARRPPLRHARMVRLEAHLAVLLAIAFFGLVGAPLVLSVGLHLGTFFLIAMVCHGELAEKRPATIHLTEFYLWMSVGGVLGGAFNALAAPLLFDSMTEYPLIIGLACALRPGPKRPMTTDVAIPATLLALILVLHLGFGVSLAGHGLTGALIVYAILGLLVFSFRKRPTRFGLGIVVLLVFGAVNYQPPDMLESERSFFGVHRVRNDSSGRFHLLQHGSTLHGAQYTERSKWREPLGYYGLSSPIGEVFAKFDERSPRGRVGIIGVGTGALTCYGLSGQTWTLFEIDPVVLRIARDTRYFHYLSECGQGMRVVVGDGRLSVQREPLEGFDLLVVDAFTSDAIPVHLLTREAVSVYLSRLSERGMLLFHISNRYMDLRSVIANVAGDLGAAARIRFHRVDQAERDAYRMPSVWVAVARRPAYLAALPDSGWKSLEQVGGKGIWTDDYSNILTVLRWRETTWEFD